MILIEKFLAFLKKDWLNHSSYKLSFVLEIASAFLQVLTFYFVGKLIGAGVPSLDTYGGDYFAFYLVGLILTTYFWRGFSTFGETIQSGQNTGTLEIMLATPTKLPVILVASSLYGFFYVTITSVIYLLFGKFLGVNFSSASILSTSIIFILTVIVFLALGLISAASVLIFKRGDPILWFVGSAGTLLGGQFFPTEMLPSWLQTVSEFIPITHSLRAARLAILRGYDVVALQNEILILLAFALLFIPLSIIIFKLAIRKAKKDGSLLKY